MTVVLLATATDATRTHTETIRLNALRAELESLGVRIESAWVLLGGYDYLLILDVTGPTESAFAAVSKIAQSGTMRTESHVAMPLDCFLDISKDVASGTY